MERLTCTPEEAAELIGIGRTKVYDLLADGSLPSGRIGSRRIIRRADVETYIARVVGAAEAA